MTLTTISGGKFYLKNSTINLATLGLFALGRKAGSDIEPEK
jgi:hypothetical protein